MKESEPGEKELRVIFEETTNRNVNAMLAHVNETRKIVKELRDKLDRQDETIREQNKQIQAFKVQLAQVQMKLYSGGTTE